MRVFSDLDQLPPFHNAVVTIGSFDGVHTGHYRILQQVLALTRACGGESVVLTFEPHPRRVLHPDDHSFKLLNTTSEKLTRLEAAGVDNVVLVPFSREFANQSAREYVEDFLIHRFHPRYIVIGYDHRFGNKREGNIAFLQQYAAQAGFEVVEIPAQLIDEIAVSSTKIRRALEACEIAHANRLLGYSYYLSGRVVLGKQIGRTLGFPTANIQLDDPYKLVPPSGIYAAYAHVGPKKHRAMLYIGERPTISGADGRSIEVNIIDFEGDLYGQDLRVEILDFIRPDKKLGNLADLQQQIEADKAEIVHRLAQHEQDRTVHDREISMQPMEYQHSEKPADEVAIVILNYNTRRHLEQFLPSVVQNSPGARIIVADNGSPDDSVAFLREQHPEVEVLELGQNYGFAQGYNEALKQVQARYYVILNSDVEVTPGWLEPVLAAMRADPALAIAQPKIMSFGDKSKFEYAGAAGGWVDYLGYPFCRGRIFSTQEEDKGQYDEAQPCFWAAGAAFFIRADLYHAFGGFDGDYFAHNEEIDLCWRLKRAGYGVWCIPQSVVYHLGGGTLEYENPRKVFLNFRNSLFTLLKNHSMATLYWLIPARLLLDGLAALRFLLKGQWRAIGAVVRAHFSFYGHWSDTLRKRREAETLVEKWRIRDRMDSSGMYRGSIVWRYYGEQVRTFSALWK